MNITSIIAIAMSFAALKVILLLLKHNFVKICNFYVMQYTLTTRSANTGWAWDDEFTYTLLINSLS